MQPPEVAVGWWQAAKARTHVAQAVELARQVLQHEAKAIAQLQIDSTAQQVQHT